MHKGGDWYQVLLLTIYIYRDVKPANIMATQLNELPSPYVYKIIDLGSAIGVKDVASETGQEASESLMTFSNMDFAG